MSQDDLDLQHQLEGTSFPRIGTFMNNAGGCGRSENLLLLLKTLKSCWAFVSMLEALRTSRGV